MPKPIRVRVWGEYALFSRPELKVERYSYDVMTPSAARGILDSIYYHPGMRWVIDRIYVQKPIRFMGIRRNEVSEKGSKANALAAMNGAKTALYINSGEAILQRASTVLRDVSYVIEAHFELVPEKMAAGDNADKFFAIICRRLQKGENFHQGYLGCREFPAFCEPFEGDIVPTAYPGVERDLGIMLYDMDYSDPQNITPLYFHAVLRDGILETPASEVMR